MSKLTSPQTSSSQPHTPHLMRGLTRVNKTPHQVRGVITAVAGFTLVELSIVLVIIGLLIGGILAAQSMIGTAKIQGLVRQVGQFDAAVENFQTKYQQLPGDSNLMGSSRGNNDGFITDDGNLQNQASYAFDAEMGKFWSDLSQGVSLNNSEGGAYVDAWAGALPDNKYVPKTALGKEVLVFAYSGSPGINYYMLTSNYHNSNAGIITLNAFKPSDALAIDTKMDDKLGSKGSIQVYDSSNYLEGLHAASGLTTGTNCTTAAGGDTYATLNSEQCSIRIRMGTSTGNLK